MSGMDEFTQRVAYEQFLKQVFPNAPPSDLEKLNAKYADVMKLLTSALASAPVPVSAPTPVPVDLSTCGSLTGPEREAIASAIAGRWQNIAMMLELYDAVNNNKSGNTLIDASRTLVELMVGKNLRRSDVRSVLNKEFPGALYQPGVKEALP